jgi:hypothetical protein
VLAGWKAVFSVVASGTTPLSYQWTRNDVDIPLATGPNLTVDPVTLADDADTFGVRVSNAAGSASAGPVVLTVTPRVDTGVMTPAWSLATGSRPYLDNQNLQRGLAHNPVGDHLLLISRTPVAGLPNPAVIVLDAATGAEVAEGEVVRTLRLTDENESPVVSGGTFALNMIDCGADGVVFAANLALVSEASIFRIYRWADDSAATVPTVAFTGDVFGTDRAGDCLKARGAGVETQLLVGARNLPRFAVLTTSDGENFTPTVFDIPELAAGSFFMTAFGLGDTIWARGEGGGLQQVGFDLTSGVATVLATFTPAQFAGGGAPLAVDPVTGLPGLLGAINRNDTPDNLRLYDVSDPGVDPVLLDLEFFTSDAANANFTGSVDFGSGRIFGLDTNNGILAMNVNAAPPGLLPARLTNLSFNGTTFSFTLEGQTGTSYKIQGSPGLAAGTWTDVQTITLAGTSQLVEIPVPQGQGAHYYRSVTQP